MGRPTIAAQLAKAAAEGDMEKVKELADRLNVKPKAKPKKKPRSKSKVEVYEEDLYIPEDEDEDVDDDTVSSTIAKDERFKDMIAPSKSNKPRTYVDENGEKKIISRVVPFKIIKNRKNKWTDDLTEEVGDIEFDKLTHKNKPKKRAARDPINKVKVRCTRCKDIKVVWPGEVMHRNWACDECLTSNKPR